MKATILIVDDESSIREALCKVLRAEGHEVLSAISGEEAIEKFATGKIDLLLLDLGLPVKEGWATLAWLDWVNPLLPIMIITGRSNQSKLAEKAGAAALMEKPLDVPCLLRTVAELLSEPMEKKVQRALHRNSRFKYVPNTSNLFEQTLLRQLNTPYPYPKMEENPSLRS